MRSGLRNAEVKLAPGGELSGDAISGPETAGRTNVAALSGAGRRAARLTAPMVVAASANSASHSSAGTAETTETVPAAVFASPRP